MRAIVCLCMAVLVASCSTYLETTKATTSAVGYPYRLKFTQFDISIKRQIVGCDTKDVDPQKPSPIKVKVSADITPKTAFDPNEFYVIDPRKLSGALKTSETQFEWYADRSAKSVSGAAEDQTGAVVASVLTGVAKLASVGIAAGAGAAPQPCKAIQDQLKKVEDADKAVADAQAAVTSKTMILARATAKVSAMGAAVDNATRAELGRASSDLEAATQELSLAQAKLATETKPLVHEAKVTWPNDQKPKARMSDAPERLPPGVVKEWKLLTDSDTDSDAVVSDLDVYLALDPLEKLEAAASSNAKLRGIPYREPVWSRLKVCVAKQCSEKGQVIKSWEGLVLQLGPRLVLPFEAPALGSTKVSANFAADGTLEKAGYSQTKAPAAGAADTFKQAAEQVAAIKTAEETRDLAEMEAKTKLAKAQKELKDATDALVTPVDADKDATIKALKKDTELANAELALVQAQRALALAKNAQ